MSGIMAKERVPPPTPRTRTTDRRAGFTLIEVVAVMNLKALRAFLYQLESGTPYVFVDTLTVQPAGAMDARIHPEKALGLEIGDAHMFTISAATATWL